MSIRTIRKPGIVYDQKWMDAFVDELQRGVAPKRIWEPYVELALWQESRTVPIYTARVPTAFRELLLWSPVNIAASSTLYTTLDIVISGHGSILRKPWSTGGGIKAEEVVNIKACDEERETGSDVQIERGQTVLVRLKHYSLPSLVGAPVPTSESEQERDDELPGETGALATEIYLQVVHEPI